LSGDPLRILQLYPKADYFTGAAIQLRDLVTGLGARGHDVTVATRPSELWTTTMRAAGARHYAVPMASPLDLRSALRIARIVRRHRIQIVHAQKGKARTLALIAGLFTPLPALVLNRGVSFPLDPMNRLGYTTRRVTAIVAVCDAIKRDLVARGVPAGKIAVIYSGTDTARFHPAVDGARVRRELQLRAEHVLITQVGVRSLKGNDDVLEAMVKVVARLPEARLCFVGATESKTRLLREHAAARGLAGVVSILPHREDVPELLAATDVSVDASYAGLGLTGALRESLAVGKPVVGTALAGNPELVVDGETGLLVPPRDPEALAAAILKLAENPAWRQELGRAGRRRVEAMFSLRAKVDATEALYRRLVAERQPA
jgi:glycosyltransferase involved in cell wall biosynthesis